MQLIGLGSAGTNIVEAFLKNKRTVELLQGDITRLSLLAIDIADPEIRALQESYDKIAESMIKAGIPAERLRLIAQSVKFPTAEAMFDFINQKYNEYLTHGWIRQWLYLQWREAQAEDELWRRPYTRLTIINLA